MALQQLQATDIAAVSNTSITGTMSSSQIASVANTAITGLLTASQIASIANTQVTGTMAYSQVPSGSLVQVAIGRQDFNGALVQGNSYTVGSAITPVTSYTKLVMIGNVYLRSPYAYGTYGDYTIGSSGIGNNLSGATTTTYSNFYQGQNSGNLGGSTYTASVSTVCMIHYAEKTTGWTTSDTPQFSMSIGPVYGGTYWGTMLVTYYFIK